MSDGMSKAAFVLWRDNLDMHLEQFGDFGIGTSGMLKMVRLQPTIISKAVMNEYYQEVRSA